MHMTRDVLQRTESNSSSPTALGGYIKSMPVLWCCAAKCRPTFFCKLCFTTDFLKIYNPHAKWSGTAKKWMGLNVQIALQNKGSTHLINFIWCRVMLMKSYTFDPPTPSSNFSPQKGSLTPVYKSSINWSSGSPAKQSKTKSAQFFSFQFSAWICCHRRKKSLITEDVCGSERRSEVFVMNS